MFTTSRTKAVIPVHLYGRAAQVDALHQFCKEKGIFMVEDAAEALGSTLGGRPVGSFGDAATFSFFGNKTVTTGEGGMILFREQTTYDLAKCLRDHGMSPQKRYWHDHVGFNYRLTNLQAAVGVAQMERVTEIVDKKCRIGEKYTDALRDLSSLQLPLPGLAGDVNTFWLYTIIIVGAVKGRDQVIKELRDQGIEARPTFYPLHEMPPYKRFVRQGQVFVHSERFSKNGLSLPSYLSLSDAELTLIAETLRRVLHSS